MDNNVLIEETFDKVEDFSKLRREVRLQGKLRLTNQGRLVGKLTDLVAEAQNHAAEGHTMTEVEIVADI